MTNRRGGIAKRREILSSCVASQADIHELYGGVVPEIASRRHIECVVQIAERAISDAGIDIKSLDAIAVTYAPGLIGALLVGVGFAKALSFVLDLPLIPVHHIRGHIAANLIAFRSLSRRFYALSRPADIPSLSMSENIRILKYGRDTTTPPAGVRQMRADAGARLPGGPSLTGWHKAGTIRYPASSAPSTGQSRHVVFSLKQR